MDENQKATQINFLQYSHRVADFTPQVKARFLRETKGAINLSIYNLKQQRKSKWSRTTGIGMKIKNKNNFMYVGSFTT